MDARVPPESEVQGFRDSLSNWGRWGADDELGTLNLILPSHRAGAAALVQEGLTVGCSRVISVEAPSADVFQQPLHYMIRSADSGSPTAADFLGLAPHGYTVTHVDALSHVFGDESIYNGFPRELVSSLGAARCSIEIMRSGIVTRGVFFDVARHRGLDYLEAGDAIYPEELEAIEQAGGFRADAGDALLLRTGWPERRRLLGVDGAAPTHRPGLHAACLPWLRDRSIAVVASDASNDVVPSGYSNVRVPIHEIGVVSMGLCLIDNCEFEELSEVSAALHRNEFMFVVAPLRVHRGTASAVNPLAIF